MKCGLGDRIFCKQKLEKETKMEQMLNDAMSLDDAVPSNSKYLAKEDVGQGMLVHISHMTLDDVESDNVINRLAVLHFHGDVKPLILKKTNKELLKIATGATTIAGVKDKQVILYNDPTIIFQGRLVGGIRIRAPQQQPTPQVTGTMPAQDVGHVTEHRNLQHTALGQAGGMGQYTPQPVAEPVPGIDFDNNGDDIPFS
jgi:hypothetical protein